MKRFFFASFLIGCFDDELVMDLHDESGGEFLFCELLVDLPFAINLAQYLQLTSKEKALRCIDGRSCTDPQDVHNLGPALAGGVVSLKAACHMMGYDFGDEEAIERLKKAGYTAKKGHTNTDHAHDFSQGTGCGANDKLPQILADFKHQHAEMQGGGRLLWGLNLIRVYMMQ